jgi:hypothetical protein
LLFVAAATLLASGCGGSHAKSPARAAPLSKPQAAVSKGLAVGVTESNPAFFWSRKAMPDDGAFGPWRDRLAALHPALVRVSVDWATVQPDPSKPPDWGLPNDGCDRGQPPCRPYDGIRELLAAIRSAQQAQGGYQIAVVIYGVPDWAAAPAQGCERPHIASRARPISDRGVQGYEDLVRSLLKLAAQEHVELHWWSPWDEPNGSFFISPQRARCSLSSPPVSADVYATLARAMKDALNGAPGHPQLVLGEFAGFPGGGRMYATQVDEFLRALPSDVICSADVWAQHAYAVPGSSRPGPVSALEQDLAAYPCARGKPIWVTETGAGGTHAGDNRSDQPAALRRDCRALADTLTAFERDPRIAAAVQYTFRDDPAFPVGLVDPGLTHTWPVYDLWRAWGDDRGPDAPPPPLPPTCRQ